MTEKSSRTEPHSGGYQITTLHFAMKLIAVAMICCFATATCLAEPTFSIAATNEPLNTVLAKISKSMGYQFYVTRGWENRPVTIELKKARLEDGLTRIIRSLGSPSNAVIRNDQVKTIEIRIFDAGSISPGKAVNITSSPVPSERQPFTERTYPASDRHLREVEERQNKEIETLQQQMEMEMEADRQRMETERQRMEMEAQRIRERHPGLGSPHP